jgi:coenzyme F420-reducing hydrogenase alpha subunit
VAWLLRTIHERHLQGLGASGVALLPKLPLEELNTRLDEDEDDQFVTRPCWHGSIYETGPVTRMADHPAVATLIQRHGCGLLARITARLAELLGLPMAIRGRLLGVVPPQPMVETLSAGPGIGLAVVETARGRLVHRVELEGTRVCRYQVLAPTEWNFHPNGPLIQGLRGIATTSPQALTEQAAMAVMALDPCVGYTISID